MNPLRVHPLKTRIFRVGENLAAFVAETVPKDLVREEMVLAVTSKIVSLAEGRLVGRSTVDKKTLVKNESDRFLGEIAHGCFLTVKAGHLIPSAGIDESNSETGDYILYPIDPYHSAERLRRDLQRLWGIGNLGIVLTDSHTTPLRRGVTGIALSYAGFRAVRDLVGTQDLFGRELCMTQMNFADGLAAAAVMTMGEGAEAQPLAIVENSGVEFCDEIDPSEVAISLEEDLYFPLLRAFLDKTET